MQNYRLENGQKLNNRYRLLRCIGQGGFGITYTAVDETLNQHVVIKEYFPVTIASRNESLEICISDAEGDAKRYEEGMKRFLSEAQVLASLFDVPGVVKVLDYFKENDTAYIVMEHVKGLSLRAYLERTGEEISFERAWQMMQPVMKALEKIHQKGLLHRDINPDNLIIEEDGNIKLLDFGSAREYFLEQDREKTMTILVKNGYAPPEQYDSKGKQGPWTDVYALCATMYEMMTGCMPPGAKERQVMDELYAPSTFDVVILPEQEEIFLKKGLALDVAERFASVSKMREAFVPEASETKHVRKKIITGIIGALIVAVLMGIWCYMTEEYVEEVQYAGNYERGSDAYESFMALVKENATMSECYAIEDISSTGTKYELSEETVREIGLPGNGYRMDIYVDDVLASAEKAGYHLILSEEENQFYVYEDPFGAIRTEFSIILTYQTEDGYELEICHDYFDQKIAYMYISRVDGQTDYNQFALDLLHGLYPNIHNDVADVKDMDEVLVQYKTEYIAGENNMRGYQLEGIVFFFRMYEETGDKVLLKVMPETVVVVMPAYNW